VVRDFETGGKTTAYQVIDELRSKHKVHDLCKQLRVSRSGYYRYLQRTNRLHRDNELREIIRNIYRDRKGVYGYRRIQAEIERRYGRTVNHKRVLRIMQEIGLKAIIRRKRWINNQYVSPTGCRVAENLLDRHFHSDQPNQKWVTDVTYIILGSQRIFLSVIMDLFNNEIVSFHIGQRNDNELVLETVRKALEKEKDVTGVILHSDRGFQYTSYEYHDMLQKVGARISMSRPGNCFDNACIESFFSHLKAETLYPYDIRDINEAQRRIEEYIPFYNEERIQIKLKKLTPVEYRRQLAA